MKSLKEHLLTTLFAASCAFLGMCSFAIADDFRDLSEHPGVLVGLVGVFAGISGWLFYCKVAAVEADTKKIKAALAEVRLEWTTKRGECQREMVEKIDTKADWAHEHNGKGKAVPA